MINKTYPLSLLLLSPCGDFLTSGIGRCAALNFCNLSKLQTVSLGASQSDLNGFLCSGNQYVGGVKDGLPSILMLYNKSVLLKWNQQIHLTGILVTKS